MRKSTLFTNRKFLIQKKLAIKNLETLLILVINFYMILLLLIECVQSIVNFKNIKSCNIVLKKDNRFIKDPLR